MLGETKSQGKELKDTNLPAVSDETKRAVFLSYNKTNKLITALYMVTDIMDKEEPLRNKLRALGVEIVSDIERLSYRTNAIYKKIEASANEVLSFLEIASGIGLISQMNSNILKTEFDELKKSIIESIPEAPENDPKWLTGLLTDEGPLPIGKKENERMNLMTFLGGNLSSRNFSKGQSSTRIGVQKGGTLLHALSKVEGNKVEGSDKNSNVLNKNHTNEGFKNHRREEILSIIKDKKNDSINFDGASIKDIASTLKNQGKETGEKTLQRELVAMVRDGVLKKKGEKRWSKYSLR